MISYGECVIGFTKGIPNTTNQHHSNFIAGTSNCCPHALTPLEIEFDSTEVLHMLQQGHEIYNALIYECVFDDKPRGSSSKTYVLGA